MKMTFHKSATAAFALVGMTALAGCGNVSRNVTKDGKGAGELVWPKVSDTTPMHANGTWPALDSLRQVHAGETKNQIAALVGYPHFSEGVLAVREWNYVFHFRTKDNPDRVCQYKVLFDDNKLAQSFWWKPESCADFAAAHEAPSPEPTKAEQTFTLSSDALFAFDKSGEADIKPEGRTQLAELASKIVAAGNNLQYVHVVGYTDRLGSDSYNQVLSQRRAETVDAFLREHGVPPEKVSAEGRGEHDSVVQCTNSKRAALIACLAPNRRVEVSVKGATI